MTKDTKELIKASSDLIWQIIKLIGILAFLALGIKGLFNSI